MNADVPADYETTDETMRAALNAVSAAEWVLVQTPAVDLPEIRERAQIVLEMFSEHEPNDNCHLAMLAILVAEIRSPIP